MAPALFPASGPSVRVSVSPRCPDAAGPSLPCRPNSGCALHGAIRSRAKPDLTFSTMGCHHLWRHTTPEVTVNTSGFRLVSRRGDNVARLRAPAKKDVAFATSLSAACAQVRSGTALLGRSEISSAADFLHVFYHSIDRQFAKIIIISSQKEKKRRA